MPLRRPILPCVASILSLEPVQPALGRRAGLPRGSTAHRSTGSSDAGEGAQERATAGAELSGERRHSELRRLDAAAT